MTLNFPNDSRSYDERGRRVRFWGYDSSLEISFFVDVGALCKLLPQTKDLEDAYLEAFDVAKERIHEGARKAYGQSRQGSYLLAAADF
jgi:hypothetical protein